MNVANIIKNELYHFAGVQCVKCSLEEFIFDFVVENKGSNNDVYTVQLLRDETNVKLGVLTLPQLIDFEKILEETPVDKKTHVMPFLRNCRQHINCRQIRKDQFEALKSMGNDAVNCYFESNCNFTQIQLHLNGVHDVESDTYYNCLLYLLYYGKETRPYKIKVDSTDKKGLNTQMVERLVTYFKCFKTLPLSEAFTQVTEKMSEGLRWKLNRSEQQIVLTESEESDKEKGLKDRKNNKKILKKSKKTSDKKVKSKQHKLFDVMLNSKNSKKATFLKKDNVKISKPLKKTSVINNNDNSVKDNTHPDTNSDTENLDIQKRLKKSLSLKKKSDKKLLTDISADTNNKVSPSDDQSPLPSGKGSNSDTKTTKLPNKRTKNDLPEEPIKQLPRQDDTKLLGDLATDSNNKLNPSDDQTPSPDNKKSNSDSKNTKSPDKLTKNDLVQEPIEKVPQEDENSTVDNNINSPNSSEDSKVPSTKKSPAKKRKKIQSAHEEPDKKIQKKITATKSRQTRLSLLEMSDPTVKTKRKYLFTSTPLHSSKNPKGILKRTLNEDLNISRISPRKSMLTKKLQNLKTK